MSDYKNIINAFNSLTEGNSIQGTSGNSSSAHPVSNDSNDSNEEIVCQLCESGDNAETLLLCDGCPAAIHTECLNMGMIPPGDWYCARCRRNGPPQQKRCPKKGDYVYLYERVSSKGQNNPEYGRVGMDTQNHELLKYCYERNMMIRGTFTDVGSGRDVDNLRDFQRMVKRMPRGTCVMVYSVSRFGRNLQQVQGYLNALHQKDCYVYAVTEGVSSFDQQFLNLVVQAQQESVQLSATMRASVARRRQEGHWIGQAPYGFEVWRDDQNRRRVRQVPNDHPEVRGLLFFEDPDLNDNQVYDALTDAGIQPRTGVWTITRVRSTRRRIEQAYQNMEANQ